MHPSFETWHNRGDFSSKEIFILVGLQGRFLTLRIRICLLSRLLGCHQLLHPRITITGTTFTYRVRNLSSTPPGRISIFGNHKAKNIHHMCLTYECIGKLPDGSRHCYHVSHALPLWFQQILWVGLLHTLGFVGDFVATNFTIYSCGHGMSCRSDPDVYLHNIFYHDIPIFWATRHVVTRCSAARNRGEIFMGHGGLPFLERGLFYQKRIKGHPRRIQWYHHLVLYNCLYLSLGVTLSKFFLIFSVAAQVVNSASARKKHLRQRLFTCCLLINIALQEHIRLVYITDSIRLAVVWTPP